MQIISDYDSCVSKILDDDIIISDQEIQALAELSKKTTAIIREYHDSGRYYMMIRFDGHNDEEILLASNNKNRYKKLSQNFFRKFINYNGNIQAVF